MLCSYWATVWHGRGGDEDGLKGYMCAEDDRGGVDGEDERRRAWRLG